MGRIAGRGAAQIAGQTGDPEAAERTADQAGAQIVVQTEDRVAGGRTAARAGAQIADQTGDPEAADRTADQVGDRIGDPVAGQTADQILPAVLDYMELVPPGSRSSEMWT